MYKQVKGRLSNIGACVSCGVDVHKEGTTEINNVALIDALRGGRGKGEDRVGGGFGVGVMDPPSTPFHSVFEGWRVDSFTVKTPVPGICSLRTQTQLISHADPETGRVHSKADKLV